MKKIICTLLVMAMLITCIPAFAADTSGIKYLNNVRISGEAKSGDFITVLLVDKSASEVAPANDEIKYINQAVCGADGKFSLMFTYEGSVADTKLLVRSENSPEEITVNESGALSDIVEAATRTVTKDGELIVVNNIENFFGISGITYNIIAAFYDSEGKLLEVSQSEDKNLQLNENSSVFKATIPESAAVQKIYVWTDSMIPVSGATTQLPGNAMFNNFEDKDEIVVALIGDSLTQHNYGLGSYKLSYQHYYMTRYPDKKITFVSKGIGGNAAPNAVARIDWDIMDCEGKTPDAALVMMGMNDAPTFQYVSGAEAIEKQRSDAYERFTSNMKSLVELLLERGVETTLMSSTLFDHGTASVLTGTDFTNSADGIVYRRNDEMARYAEFMKNLAKEKNLNYIPMNEITTTLTEEIRSSAGNADIAVFTKEDRVHPVDDSEGAYLLGILAAMEQTENSVVADVEIDADGLTAKTQNADIENIVNENGVLSYTYTPKSLPLAVNTAYKNISGVFEYDIASFANNENLKIKNLSDGNYKISMNGAVVGTYSATELENGINIAENSNNPSQKKALEAFELLDDADDLFDAYVRAYIRVVEVIKAAGYDYTRDAQVRAYYGDDVNSYNYFVSLRDGYEENLKKAISYREQSRAKCSIESYTVTVEACN